VHAPAGAAGQPGVPAGCTVLEMVVNMITVQELCWYMHQQGLLDRQEFLQAVLEMVVNMITVQELCWYMHQQGLLDRQEFLLAVLEMVVNMITVQELCWYMHQQGLLDRQEFLQAVLEMVVNMITVQELTYLFTCRVVSHGPGRASQETSWSGTSSAPSSLLRLLLCRPAHLVALSCLYFR
jgi:uncharacterized protein YqgQ